MRLARSRMASLRAVPLLALALAAGCSVAPPRGLPEAPPEVLWEAHAGRLGALEAWAFNGRAALSGDEVPSRTVRIRWQQADGDFDIAFQSPIGQRLAELSGNTDGVTLRLPGETPVVAADSAELLEAALGWSAPVESLRYWVLGLPDPAAQGAPELDPWGRVTRLWQDDWIVEFAQYVDVGNLELPRRLTVSHPGLRIRLVIDRWDLGGRNGRV